MSREPIHLLEQTDFSLRYAHCANGEHPLRIDALKEVSTDEAAGLIATLPSNATIVFASRPKSRALHLANADETKRHAGIAGIRKFVELSATTSTPIKWFAAVTARNGGAPADLPWLLSTASESQQPAAIAELETHRPKSLQIISATLASAGALASTAGRTVLMIEVGELASHAMLVGPEGVLAAGTIPLDLAKLGEAVQAELNLKFRGSAVKLFFNADYDFTDTGPKIAARIAESIKPDLSRFLVDRPAPTELFVTGLPASQQWFGPHLATALGLAHHAPDLKKWSVSRGVSFAKPELATGLSSTWFALLHVLHDHTLATSPATPPWHAEWSSAETTVAAPAPLPVPAASVAVPTAPVAQSTPPAPAKGIAAAPAPAKAAAATPVQVPAPAAIPPKPASPPSVPQNSVAAPVPVAPSAASTATPAPKIAAPAPAAKVTAVTNQKPTKSLIAAAAAKAPVAPARSDPSSVKYSTKLATPAPTPAPKSVVGPKPAEPVAATIQTPPVPPSRSVSLLDAPHHTPKKKSSLPVLVVALAVLSITAGGYFFFNSQSKVAAQLELVKQEAEARLKNEAEKTRLAELKAEEEAEARRKLEAEFSQKLVDSEIARQQAESKALAESAARMANARGALVITTNPAGATVTVGDLPPQTSPATFSDIRIGSYPITISLARHEDVRLTLDVAENATTNSGTIPLVALIGSLQIESEPAIAQYEIQPANALLIDPASRRSGNTPATLNDLSAGDYRVTLTRDGWAPHTQIVTVARGETTQLRWMWPNAVVKITSTPSGATVMQGGAALGATPLTLNDQPPGETSFEIVLDRYDSIPLSSVIEEGKVNELTATFRPEDRIFTNEEVDRKAEPIGAKQPELPYYLTLENSRAEIQLIVNRDGTIRDVSVVHASNPDLGKYLIEALEKWQFKPGTKGGVPVNVMIRVPFAFKSKA